MTTIFVTQTQGSSWVKF